MAEKNVNLRQAKYIQILQKIRKGSQTFFATLTGFIFFATARILFSIPTCKLDFYFGFQKKMQEKIC